MNHITFFQEQNKGQDFFYIDNIDEHTYFCIIADGHGRNTVIDHVRYCINFKEIIESNDITQKLYEAFENIDTKSSGSTVIICIVTENIENESKEIQFYYVGNSKIYLYENKKLIFNNTIHDIDNKKEMDILKKQNNVVIDYTHKLCVLNDFMITLEEDQNASFTFNNEDKISVTHCLGHNFKRKFLEYKKIKLSDDKSKIYKLILCTKGCSHLLNIHYDHETLLTKNAMQLGHFIKKRWNQDWYILKKHHMYKSSFHESIIDDITIITAHL